MILQSHLYLFIQSMGLPLSKTLSFIPIITINRDD